MRTEIVKVIFLLFWAGQVLALDLTAYENQCADIGFKRKTPTFGECVLELNSRDSKIATQAPAKSSSGDGSPDHATCAKYGFTSGTNEYAQCRMQIDLAKKQAAEQQRQYEEQLAAQRRAQGIAALRMAGQISGGGGNFGAVQAPSPIRNYTLPGGRTMTCTTTGAFTNCN